MESGTLKAALWDGSEAPDASDDHVFALVDHAGAAGLMSRLQRPAALPWISLFENSLERRALEVAPILVDLGRVADGQSPAARVLLNWLLATCATSNAVLLLRSAYPHDRLAAALARRLDAMLPERMAVMLRYFDTRVFVSLLAVLHPDQRHPFLGIAARWWWLDRAGALHSVAGDVLAADAMPSPLVLDEAQQAALIEAADADVVVLQLLRHAPDLCAGRSRAALHALSEACLPAARHYGIGDIREQTLFCLTALETDPSFYKLPHWQEALQRKQQAGQSFGQLLQEMELR